jgi:hypothetical protein
MALLTLIIGAEIENGIAKCSRSSGIGVQEYVVNLFKHPLE